MNQTDSVSITFRRFSFGLVFSVVIIGATTFVAGTAHAGNLSQDNGDGTFNLPAVSLPPSSFLDDEARAALRHARDHANDEAASRKACPSMESACRLQKSLSNPSAIVVAPRFMSFLARRSTARRGIAEAKAPVAVPATAGPPEAIARGGPLADLEWIFPMDGPTWRCGT